MKIEQLPTHEQCTESVNNGFASALEKFIFENEPAGEYESETFRLQLLDLINEIKPVKEPSNLAVFERMVEEDNKGILMSNAIVSVSSVSQGSIIGFGVEKRIGEEARIQMAGGLPGEFMIFCMAVNRSELQKTKEKMKSE